MKHLWISFFVWINVIFSHELPILYEKNYEIPTSTYEMQLIHHAKMSVEKALGLQSKLTGTKFGSDHRINILPSDCPSDHLLNNLCSLPKASHLHVGLLKGGSFIAALYGNQETLQEQIGIDWFQEYPQDAFYSNCLSYLHMDKCRIINSSCFNLDKSLFTSPIDIYFYDADHSLLGQQNAFTYYNDVFSEVFIAVVDDWEFPWVRRPTFKAFEKLNYRILYETYIPHNERYGHGQYIVVIKKSVLPK